MASDRDSEYTSFVRAQGDALYRTAFLLTGDHRAAEELLEAALAKVYVQWSRTQDLTQPEAYARRMLVDLAVSGRRRRSAEELPVGEVPQTTAPPFDDDRAAMWQLVRALPTRQRAVLVLRYYEELSDAEIAELLDVAPGIVRAQAHSAVTSLLGRERDRGAVMDVDGLVRRTLQDTADSIDPPPVDIATVRRRAVHGRNRAVGGIAAAAMATAVVVSAMVVGQDRPSSGRVDDDRVARSLQGPVWGDHTGLHAGDTTLRMDGRLSGIAALGVVRNGILVAEPVGFPEEPVEIMLYRLGREPELVGVADNGAVGDPRGSLAAWFEGRELVVVDTSTGVEEVRLAVGEHRALLGLGARVPVLHLDEDEVVYAADGAVWRLGLDDPEAVPHRLGGSNVLDVGPGVRVIAARSSVNGSSVPVRATELEIRVDGRSVGRFGPVMAEASLSPDGRYVATATEYEQGHRLVVLDTATAKPVALPLPDRQVLPTGYPWGWVGEDTLVVALAGAFREPAILALMMSCDVGAARCDRLATTTRPLVPH